MSSLTQQVDLLPLPLWQLFDANGRGVDGKHEKHQLCLQLWPCKDAFQELLQRHQVDVHSMTVTQSLEVVPLQVPRPKTFSSILVVDLLPRCDGFCHSNLDDAIILVDCQIPERHHTQRLYAPRFM